MNVYDFDGTIYNGDSSVDFVLFCLRNYFSTWKRIPVIIISAVKYKLKIIDAKKFKEDFFSVLKDITDVDRAIDIFWDLHISKITQWYAERNKSTDIIISASPEFLLLPLKDKLGVQRIIGTVMETKTGIILGENCKGKVKVDRLKIVYPTFKIENFYSDSKSDIYLANLSENAYYVSRQEITKWES